MKRGGRTAAQSVVANVQRQAREAELLAGIAGQERLASATLNPATRPHADRLRDEEQHQALDARHKRVQRRLRVVDGQAAEAERTLEALALARRTSSPARSVLALHSGRRAYGRVALGLSLALAAGSGMGLEAVADHLGAPTGSGYIAELGLTVLSTVAISVRAWLSEHRATLESGSWQSRTLWLLMTVPLLISISCNLSVLNPIGAFCALGAAAFALLGVVIADRASDGMKCRADEVDEVDEVTLRTIAMAEEIPSATPATTVQDAVPAVAAAAPVPALPSGTGEPVREVQGGDKTAAEAEQGVTELEEWLARQDPPESGGTRPDGGPSRGPSGDGGQDGAARALPVLAADEVSKGGHIDGGQDPDPGHIESDRPDPAPAASGAERVEPAVQARLAAGDATRERVGQWLTAHPDATRAEAARALRVSESTVKRAKRARRAPREEKGGRS